MNAKEAAKLTKKSIKENEEKEKARKAAEEDLRKHYELTKPKRIQLEFEKIVNKYILPAAKSGETKVENIEIDSMEVIGKLKENGYTVTSETNRVPERESYADYQGQAFRETGNYVDETLITISWGKR